LLSGASAVALAPRDVRLALVIPASLAAMLFVAILARREHTTFGEMLSAIALSSFAMPLARASDAALPAALTCALVFTSAFVAGTLCVRAVIAATHRPPALSHRLGSAIIAAGAVVALQALASGGRVSHAAPWAAAPVCAGGLILVLLAPSARHLRTIGWALVASTTATAAILIAALR